jgi:hypothetical protein
MNNTTKITIILLIYITIILFFLKWFLIIDSWFYVFLPIIIYISFDILLSFIIIILCFIVKCFIGKRKKS